ncbi:thioredoxin, partial [Pseudomonas sp. GW531-T4]
MLHFSANWCPTCTAQKASFSELEKSGLLKGIVLLVADYDKEEELKKQMKVTHQSTLISFYGGVETG